METLISKRCSNFSKEEEHLLVSLVGKYKDIIESKETNAVTWKKKNEKWMQIEKEFNANSGLNGCRSMKMLKEKYLNLKKKTKRKISQNKVNMNQTGGGPCIEKTLTDVDEAISDLLGQRITGLPSFFDSDRDTSAGQEQNGTEIFIINDSPECIPETEVSENIASGSGDWEKYCPKDLLKPVNPKLAVSNRKAVLKTRNAVTKEYNSINRELIEKKLEFVRHQQQKFDEEHKLKILSLNKDLETKDKNLQKVNLGIQLLKKKMDLIDKQLQLLNKEQAF